MPKPNQKRQRVNVDLGPRCQFLLQELLAHYERIRREHQRPATTSRVLRKAIQDLAARELDPEVLSEAFRIQEIQAI